MWLHTDLTTQKKTTYVAVVALFVLLLSSGINWNVEQDKNGNVLYSPSANPLLFIAEAAPLGPRSYPLSIGNAVGCKVCHSIASHVLAHVQMYMDRHNKTSVASYEVEDFLEHICDPNNIAGAWIRRVGLQVVPDDPSNATSAVHLEIIEFEGYAKCQRACVTVRDYCTLTKEHSHFDAFVPEVASLSLKARGGQLATRENEKYLQDKICKRFYACMKLERIMISAARDLNHKEDLRKLMETDVVELLPPEELAKALTAYQSQKRHSLAIGDLTGEDLEKLQSPFFFEDHNMVSRGANKMYESMLREGGEEVQSNHSTRDQNSSSLLGTSRRGNSTNPKEEEEEKKDL